MFTIYVMNVWSCSGEVPVDIIHIIQDYFIGMGIILRLPL